MKPKSRSEVVVDRERAHEVLSKLYAAYMRGEGLFRLVNRDTHAPQRMHFPSGVVPGDQNHQRWLFFAVMTDRREESNQVYASHVRLAARMPQLYTREAAAMDPEEITRILKSEKVGLPTQSGKYWPRAAKTLFEEFEGNPLNLYKAKSINALLRFKRRKDGDQLPGFGPKILSLLSLFLEELGLMRMPEDAFPVDVHVQRFAISTKILQGDDRVESQKIEQILRPLLCEIVSREKWSALELSHAIWFVGNRLCSGCYRTTASRVLCPSYAQCAGSISTMSYFRKGEWELGSPRHRKGGDCTLSLPKSSLFFPKLNNAN